MQLGVGHVRNVATKCVLTNLFSLAMRDGAPPCSALWGVLESGGISPSVLFLGAREYFPGWESNRGRSVGSAEA